MSEISRGLKILARELETPVVALCQLSRGLEMRARTSARCWPTSARAGRIEQDADVVMFIYRDAMYDRRRRTTGTREIIVAKHRNGPTGTVHLTFLPRFAKFEDGAKNI